MDQKILITGAAGYIGGSILADLISRKDSPIKASNISAAVRSEVQVQALSKLGVNILQVDFRDEAGVLDAVLKNKIDIVVHTTSSMDPKQVSNILKALGERREISGEDVYFIQSSVNTMFAAEGGWKYGEVKDSDEGIFEKEKELQSEGYNPVRAANILTIEEAKAQGVKSYIIPVPSVYGRGTGEWKKVSEAIAPYIRTSIAHKTVHKFEVEGNPPRAHISDLTSLYALILENILHQIPIPSGENGYYFAVAHSSPWYTTLNLLSKHLFKRGLINSDEILVWPSLEVAAEWMGYPLQYIVPMCMSGGGMIPVNAFKLGWEPKWDQEKFLANLDDEIETVLELDTKKTTTYDALKMAGK